MSHCGCVSMFFIINFTHLLHNLQILHPGDTFTPIDKESTRDSTNSTQSAKRTGSRMTLGFIVLSLLLLPTAVTAFRVDREITYNHQEITKRAIFEVTVEVCRSVAESNGKAFTFPTKPYTVESVAAACDIMDGLKAFHESVKSILNVNIKLDKSGQFESSGHHFHNEMFNAGRDIIAAGLTAVKANNKKGNVETAKQQLGKITHTLQDFYSNSNWIELGMTSPNAELLNGNGNVGTVAALSQATCRNCIGQCTNNILNNIIKDKILTSGYYTVAPDTSKPAGKCSNGSPMDASRTVSPTGGINKDTPVSSHGHLHEEAANMAISATVQLLQDIRAASGDENFLRMIGATSGKPLVFAIDTTASMTQDIKAVQVMTDTIISNSKAGLQAEPSVYVLVTFHDPDPATIFKTTDSKAFTDKLAQLVASGGGDRDENSLTGLEVALTGAPPGSDIFMFTDAGAKDKSKKDSVMALLEQTKSTVNIVLTGNFVDVTEYKAITQASGGQLLSVPVSDLGKAADLVFDSSSASSMVTLLDETRESGKSENFTFMMDETTKDVMIYVTGPVTSVEFVDPSGDKTGDVVDTSSIVGNFRRIHLKEEVGEWEMRVKSNFPYTAKIVGDSPLDFIYDIMGPAQGPLGGTVAQTNRPKAGEKANVELTLIGSETATVTEVLLLTPNGTVEGKVTSLGNKEYSVEFDPMPAGESRLLVKGKTGQGSSKTFQRLSPAKIMTSSISVIAEESSGLIEPGASVKMPFTISSPKKGAYTIKASNNKGFPMTFPTRLEMVGSSIGGEVVLSAPSLAQSGSEVTVTISVEDEGKTEMNYAISSFTVQRKVTDFTKPVCEKISQTSCPESCSSSTWEVKVRVTDGEGLVTTSLALGNGTMTHLPGSDTVTCVTSCCTKEVEIVAVDSVANDSSGDGAKKSPNYLEVLVLCTPV
uniref:von Willebrand factor A domain-containing protein 7-like n=1 Tax=Knipowitschia caucasica TaxID=637954 RepID=A0AAV2JA24_KNICA